MPPKTLKERELEFGEGLKEFNQKYERQTLVNFFYYWTEPNKSQTKMRFELQKTWDLSRRLRTWERNNLNWNKNGTATNRGNSPNGDTKLGTSEARIKKASEW